MKKLIVAFLLAVCMCFGLADTAEATEKNAPAVFEITTEDSFQSALQKSENAGMQKQLQRLR